MEEYIKKTANIEEMKEVLKNLENNYKDFKDSLSKLKGFFYKNDIGKVFGHISMKIFFMDSDITDLIKEIKRFERKC